MAVRRVTYPNGEFIDIPVFKDTQFLGENVCFGYDAHLLPQCYIEMHGKRISTCRDFSVFSCGGLFAKLKHDKPNVSFFIYPKEVPHASQDR